MPDQLLTVSTQTYRVRQRLVRLLLLLLLPAVAALAYPALGVRAQDELCFTEQAAAITACISGRFRTFWETQGGLQVFGYPLTDADYVATDDGVFLTQYFERARFELHPDQPEPYDVQLGRIGVERLGQLGQEWQELPPEIPEEGCQFWPETQHNICGSMLRAWRLAGLQLDDQPALSSVESLALWGLPITPETSVQTVDGVVRTQWFERARFEQQGDGPITFGLLGRELLGTADPTPPAPPAPAPPGQEPPTPVPAPTAVPVPSVPAPSVPCNRNVPTPAEGIQVWMTDPNPSRDTDAVACVRLIIGGQAANGANVMAYRYLGEERRPSIPQSTGLDGVASFIFYIAETNAGQPIPVEAIATYRGITYGATTVFVPR